MSLNLFIPLIPQTPPTQLQYSYDFIERIMNLQQQHQNFCPYDHLRDN